MKLLTWNIQWGRGADGRVDLDRIAAEIARLGEMDVICLQEVACGYPELPGNDDSDQFAAIAARFPKYQAISGFAVDAYRPGGRRRFGNMLLSRLPVWQAYRHLLPWPSDPEVQSMQRVAVEANLGAPFGPLRVTTTHLEYYSAIQREAQIERLRELHREAVAHAHHPGKGKKGDGPFAAPQRAALAILAGDCNFRPDAPEHARLLHDIDGVTPPYRDAWDALHPGQAHAPTVGLHDKTQWPGEPFTFDFFFVSDDLLPRVRSMHVDPVSAASDHQPLVLELA